MTESKPVRVRFAPSPTGKLHVGGARTAIYNWAFARATGGTFVLRIEDTDPHPLHRGEHPDHPAGHATGWDSIGTRAPSVGGNCGPYFQTQRTDTYRGGAADAMIDAGARLPVLLHEGDAGRQARGIAEAEPRAVTPATTAPAAPSPATRPPARIAAGEPHVWRLEGAATSTARSTFNDAVYGHMCFPIDVMDDMILRRTDGTFTYNFAVVCDDVNMRHHPRHPRRRPPVQHPAPGADLRGPRRRGAAVRAPAHDFGRRRPQAVEAPRRHQRGGVPRQGLSCPTPW